MGRRLWLGTCSALAVVAFGALFQLRVPSDVYVADNANPPLRSVNTTNGPPNEDIGNAIVDHSLQDKGGTVQPVHNLEKAYLHVEEEQLERMGNLMILPREGVVFCPIPKVASTEWKRAFRWVMGYEDWKGEHVNIHPIVVNGLQRLVDWGTEGTEWVLNNERFFRFVILRDPAERIISGFLNKCVIDGYISGKVSKDGAPNCDYLKHMPELFPDHRTGSKAAHARFKDLMEKDPEDVFFHFASGIQRALRQPNGACVVNHHFRPQYCFCELTQFLPAFHVIPFSNMSAEAATIADHFPRLGEGFESSVQKGEQVEVAVQRQEQDGDVREWEMEGVGQGIGDERRKEINAFMSLRFDRSHDTKEKVTHSAERKAQFLSPRVRILLQEMYAEDYDLFQDYFHAP